MNKFEEGMVIGLLLGENSSPNNNQKLEETRQQIISAMQSIDIVIKNDAKWEEIIFNIKSLYVSGALVKVPSEKINIELLLGIVKGVTMNANISLINDVASNPKTEIGFVDLGKDRVVTSCDIKLN